MKSFASSLLPQRKEREREGERERKEGEGERERERKELNTLGIERRVYLVQFTKRIKILYLFAGWLVS